MTKRADLMQTLNEWLDKGKDAVANIAPGEWGWGAVGASGGAMLGYTLSRLLHRKPNMKTKLLYALLGAAAGGAGSHYLLKNMPSSSGKGSKLEEIRDSATNGIPEPIDEADVPKRGKPGLLRPRNTAAAAAILGAYRGARLGNEKGKAFNFNVYETWRHQKGRDLKTLQDQLNRTYANEAARQSHIAGLNNRINGYDARMDALGKIRLEDNGLNWLRGTTNAASNALIHGGTVWLGHTLLNAGLRRLTQDIDASNAAASRDQLIKNLIGE